jgi:hypothetical protein
MADHKFVYTVSGVDLNDEQQRAISQEIGNAVTRALLGHQPKAAKSEFLNICKIHGGLWTPMDLAGKKTVGDLAAQSGV